MGKLALLPIRPDRFRSLVCKMEAPALTDLITALWKLTFQDIENLEWKSL